MQLKSLEIQGFKSFPDKTVLNFDSGITAIVGPNGSGKSNIADAVRWVMGETSSKTLRGTKMEDVIFDGTQTRRSVGFAQVSLILDNSDGGLPIDYNEVVISRRYYRSGESEYYLNSTLVRLKDINDLLRNTGLGKDGYSIIGQGGITQIISAKSTERRFLFEEAAGISKFKYKKEESEKKLALTQENIQRLSDIINELKDRLVPLEEQSAKAKQFLRMRDERKAIEVGLWIKSLKTLDEDLKKTENNSEILKKDLENAEKELAQNEENIETHAEEQNKLTAEIERLRANNRLFEDDIQSKAANILVTKNDIEYTNRDILRIKQENEVLDGVKKQLLADKEGYQTLLSKTSKELEDMDIALQEILRLKQEKAGDEKEYFQKTENLRKQIESLNSEITSLRIKQERTIQNIENLENQKTNLLTDIADSEERYSLLEKSRETLKQDIEKNSEKLAENKNILSGYLLKSDNNKKLFERQNSENNNLKINLSDKQNRLRMLEDLEKNYEGFAGSVHMLMNEVKKGVLTGVCGTVASVIDVSGDYTLSIETALGAAIQNIVTEDEDSAKSGIYFLKNKNAGRATFLPLTSIKGNRLNDGSIKNEQGFIGVASDLVRYDIKYKNIVDFLLGRSVVADNIDNAVRIAKKYKYTFKIITLDGQVINAGGSMTGGSAARNTGILSRRNEIAALEKQTKDLASSLEKHSVLLKNTISEMERVSVLVESTVSENKTYEETLIKLRNDLLHNEQYLKNMAEQKISLKTDLENSERSLCEYTNSKEQTNVLLDEKQAEVQKLKSSLEEYENTDLILKAEQETMQTEIYNKNLEVLEKKKNIENITAKIAQTDEKINSDELAAEKNNKEAEMLELKVSEFNENISNIENEIKKLKDLTIQATEDINEKINRRFLFEKEINRLREEQKNLFSSKEGLIREIERSDGQISAFLSSRENIVSRMWDEYELTLSEAESTYKIPENSEAAHRKVSELKNSMKVLGEVNLASIEEYTSVKQRYENLSAQVDDLVKSKAVLEKIIIDLLKEMEEIFAKQFEIINEAFGTVFKQLFNGGSATLQLVDPDNILETGIEIYVAPPGKIIKHLSSLSGGEQTLTAIALYFAILKIKPAPFCLLDEIEAALDEINVAKFAEYLQALSAKTQFIVITHRRGTMEVADRLCGVTMKEKGISRVITLNVNEIEQNT